MTSNDITGPGFAIVRRDSTDLTKATVSDMRLSDSAKADLAPVGSFTGGSDGHRGPVLATVDAYASTVWVGVDPRATVPTVRVYCDPASPYARAARGAVIVQTGDRLTVTVPEVTVPAQSTSYDSERHGGSHFDFRGAVINGNFVGKVQTMTVTSGGQRSYSSSGNHVSGSQYVSGGSVINGHTGVEVEILLPADSGLKAVTRKGGVHTFGHLAAADLDVREGPANVDSAGRLKVRLDTGPITAGTITGWLDGETTVGPITVKNYQGSQCRVHTASGPVTFTIGRQASGAARITTGAGPLTVHGARDARARGMRIDAHTGVGPYRET